MYIFKWIAGLIFLVSTRFELRPGIGVTEHYEDQQTKVPVLCYHYIKKNTSKASLYSLPEEQFFQQMKMLRASGYETILPDDLYSSFTTGAALPAKTLILSFDDAHEEHFFIVAPILNQLGFKGVFFITTVVIGKPGYMTASQIKELSDSGHVIGAHTWNHPNIQNLSDRDIVWQIDKPKQDLEKITGKPVQHFAYPYGVWNDAAISKLKKHGIRTAFQLTEKQSEKQPMHTVRRLMVSGLWSQTTLLEEINATFLPGTAN